MLLYLYNTGLTQMSKILSPFSGGVSGEGDIIIFGVPYIPYAFSLTIFYNRTLF